MSEPGSSDLVSAPAELFSLADRTAVVTGASTGLGRRFAEVLAGAGARVGLVARGAEGLRKAETELAERSFEARVFPADVTDPKAVRRLVADVGEELGPVDVLVNDAGTAVFKGTFDFRPEDWDTVLATDLTAVWLMCQAVIEQMVQREAGGSVINISSGLAARTIKGSDHAYPTAKAGVEHLTRSLAGEFADRRVRVNAIAPGWFPTDMNRSFLESEAGREVVTSRVPMGRTGRTGELDGAMLFLASDASSYMTGAVLRVDGGLATFNF